MLSIKTKKSAGVKVTAAVHRLITRGNAARSVGDWALAADLYRDALELDPDLTHIWIQRGHAANEASRWAEAEDAYREAIARGADASETSLYIGHMFKRSGNSAAAANHYLDAARAGDADALAELGTRVGRLISIDRHVLERAIRVPTPSETVGVDMGRAVAAIDTVARANVDPKIDIVLAQIRQTLADADMGSRSAVDSGLSITYDISDLVAHFRNHRLPTGIQRVQIEVLTRALQDRSCISRICCFADGNEVLTEIPAPMFAELADLARLGTDSEEGCWVEAVARLFIHLAIAPPYEFVENECLVNLGTSWWIYNYFLFVRNAKRQFNIRFATVVFDLIPLLATEHCVRGVSEDYLGWLVGAFRHTDHFLVISESTGRDLVRAAEQLGYRDVAEKVTAIPLDADFRSPLSEPSPSSALGSWNLGGEDYALFVSTIESRKNHVLVLDAWAELLRRDDRTTLPQLVFVGRNGWLNDQVFSRLAANPSLRRKVTIIERASDEDLALLYRSCLFTVYPSLYEGWGLPVTESLCYGKLPVVADNSSLPEAGKDFALFFESNSVPALTAALEKVLSNPEWRQQQEARIKSEFAPRPWSQVADQVIANAKALAAQPSGGWSPPPVEEGQYYPLRRYRGVRIWRGLESGEIFRLGNGWHWPDDRGSRTREGGGDLHMTLPAGDGPWRLYLHLSGLDSEECPYEISIGGSVVAAGSLLPRQSRWAIGASFSADGGRELSVHVRGLFTEQVDMILGGSPKPRVASIGVNAFYLFREGNTEAHLALIQAASLNGLDEVNAYRERRWVGAEV
jgi:glycosyltransferase involved in cell wall biosynthesis